MPVWNPPPAGGGGGAAFSAGVSTLGNTLGNTGTVSNQIVFAGGANVTLSQSTAAGGATITISAAAGGGAAFSAGASNLGNTLGNTGTVSNQIVFAGGNNITLSQSTNAGGATVTISAFTQTVQTQGFLNSISLVGNTAGQSSAGTGSVILAGGNNITLSGGTAVGGMTVTISAANQTVQTQGFLNSISVLGNTAGNTTAGTGSIVFAGGNNITLSGATAVGGMTLTVSAANQSAVSNTAGISNLGNTSGTSGVISADQIRFLIAGGNNITLSQSINGASATVTISAFTQTVQTQGFLNSISLVGNTAGATSAGTGSIVLAGGPNITLSGSTAAGGMTVSISGGAGGGAAGTNTLGMSNLGNTSGTSGVVTGSGMQFVWAGGNNVTLSQSLNGSSGTITISAFNQSVQTQGFLNSISVLGNTTGTTSAGTGSIIIAGGNNVTLSGSTAAGGMTLTVIAGRTLSRWFNWDRGTAVTNILIPGSVQFRSAVIHPLQFAAGDGFEGDMTISTMLLAMSGNMTAVTTSTAGFTYTYSAGIYTEVNSTQLSLLYQASSSFGATANSNNSSLVHGPRFFSVHSSQWSNNAAGATTPSLRGGSRYFMLHIWNSSSDSHALNWRAQFIAQSDQLSGTFGISTATATSMQFVQWAGPYSATFLSAIPASIGLSQIQGANARAGFMPAMIFENVLSKY